MMFFLKKIARKALHYADRSEDIYKIYCKAHRFYKKGHQRLAAFFGYKNYKKYNCDISYAAEIGADVMLPHPIGVVIGSGVVIGKNVTIYQNVTLGRKNKDKDEYPKVSDDVTIYCNSTIIGGITIGKGAVIGCGSIVLRDVKPGETVHGVVK